MSLSGLLVATNFFPGLFGLCLGAACSAKSTVLGSQKDCWLLFSPSQVLVFSRFLRPWPKNAPKPMEKQKKQKKTTRGFCNCVSPTISVAHFSVFFVFLFLGFLGKKIALTNIHWHSFHPSTFYIDVFIELLILATEPLEKMYRKNNSITHLFRHSIGLMFYWYAEVLVSHV